MYIQKYDKNKNDFFFSFLSTKMFNGFFQIENFTFFNLLNRYIDNIFSTIIGRMINFEDKNECHIENCIEL